jgi:hypothetical protein
MPRARPSVFAAVAAVTAGPIRSVSALANVGSSAHDPRATLLLVPDRRDPKPPERGDYEQGKTRQQGSEETQEGPRTQSSRPADESGADGCKHASTKEAVADQGRCHLLHGGSMIATGHPERAGCWANELAHRVGSLEDDPRCRSVWLVPGGEFVESAVKARPNPGIRLLRLTAAKESLAGTVAAAIPAQPSAALAPTATSACT